MSDFPCPIQDHLLVGAEYCASPNCNERPQAEISLLVIHNISLPPGQFGGAGIRQLFTNCLDPDEHPYYREIHQLEVSAHLLIDRAGSITQFVPFDKRAWHAGRSSFQGREACNDFSIGIELEGDDDTPYSDSQYAVLVEVTRALMASYPAIKPERICGHSDIAPGRKTDPGSAFDWQRYRQAIAGN
ncbi:1,6-anhydro-N-acetylmuramyl-L-alanine amidase AmpD [Marinobacterium sp. D7]|uniref:1,6-anhydro-N-acetylmuramyl-L-alanine amidase AmpD n=1 Tax=Marinobacterium ramblicola TaxID=2849041 RepID=UPI001C2D9907|nr:1,6-anhydro-N-acetylmuramyl-L-alanine amidase AmpD [Marinobacterium ramblicola]MBV1787114.1 1,6-anhydro-N-acetylmuramyl-L-alanine amidase AmpD [Marinobacterium ramblicola]